MQPERHEKSSCEIRDRWVRITVEPSQWRCSCGRCASADRQDVWPAEQEIVVVGCKASDATGSACQSASAARDSINDVVTDARKRVAAWIKASDYWPRPPPTCQLDHHSHASWTATPVPAGRASPKSQRWDNGKRHQPDRWTEGSETQPPGPAWHADTGMPAFKRQSTFENLFAIYI